MTEKLSPSSSQTIAAARLLRPQGRRGELLAEFLADLPGILVAGRHAWLKDMHSTSATETTIESSWFPAGRNAGRIVLKLAGIDTISAAEPLAGRELLILASDLPPLDPDTWFVRDLIGCELFDGVTPAGQITGVEYPMSPDGKTRLPDAPPLLEVTVHSNDRGNKEPRLTESPKMSHSALIPFVKAWLDSVDLDRKRIVMHLPPGLIDLRD